MKTTEFWIGLVSGVCIGTGLTAVGMFFVFNTFLHTFLTLLG